MADKIYLADKLTQDQIKAKTDLIGVSNPTTGGTDTAMNFLKKISDLLGAANPSAGNATTAMNYLKKLENYLTVVGNAYPSSADTSTVMNYLKQLENKLDGKLDPSKVTPFSIAGSFSTGSYTTIHSVTGKGSLSSAYLGGNERGNPSTLKITIDGVVQYHGYEYSGYSALGIVKPELMGLNSQGRKIVYLPIGRENAASIAYFDAIQKHPYTSQDKGVVVLTEPIHFKSSLKVEAMCSAETTYLVTGGLY